MDSGFDFGKKKLNYNLYFPVSTTYNLKYVGLLGRIESCQNIFSKEFKKPAPFIMKFHRNGKILQLIMFSSLALQPGSLCFGVWIAQKQ